MGKVYIELLFLDNAAINFIVLYLASRLVHKKVKNYRIIIAAAVGGVYAVAAFCLWETLFHLFFKLFVSVAMCAILYGVRKWRLLIKSTALFLFVSFVIAGAMIATAYVMNINIVGGAVFWVDAPAVRYVLTGGVVGILMLEFALKHIARSTVIAGREYQIQFKLFDQTINLSAMVDTGNNLHDPLSGRGVIIAHLGAVAKQLRGENAELIRDYEKLAVSQKAYALKPRLFTYGTIGGGGTLYAVRPEAIQLSSEEDRYTARAYIAFSPDSLGEYDAILGPDLKMVKESK